MLLHCDLVVLAENALLSTPFVNLALVPEAASSLLMPLRIGYARAYEMFALGEPVDARSAVTWGLANRVVPLDKLDAEAKTLAARLARQPAGALGMTKRLTRISGGADGADPRGKRTVRRASENRGGARGLHCIRRAPAPGLPEARGCALAPRHGGDCGRSCVKTLPAKSSGLATRSSGRNSQKILPGLRMPAGSSAVLSRRITSISLSLLQTDR